MQDLRRTKLAEYILLFAASASLVLSLSALAGAGRPSAEAIFMRVGSPVGLILLAFGMLTRPRVTSRYFILASMAVLVVVLVLQARRMFGS